MLSRVAVDPTMRIAPRMENRWSRRFLSLCPTAIAVLWVAGVAHFRHVTLAPLEWATMVAAAFAMSALLQGLQSSRPGPALPERTDPVALAAMAAAVIAVLATVIGTGLELVMEQDHPTDVSLALRTTWHAACAFGASYCTFLWRLSAPRPPTTGQPPRSNGPTG